MDYNSYLNELYTAKSTGFVDMISGEKVLLKDICLASFGESIEYQRNGQPKVVIHKDEIWMKKSYSPRAKWLKVCNQVYICCLDLSQFNTL